MQKKKNKTKTNAVKNNNYDSIYIKVRPHLNLKDVHGYLNCIGNNSCVVININCRRLSTYVKILILICKLRFQQIKRLLNKFVVAYTYMQIQDLLCCNKICTTTVAGIEKDKQMLKTAENGN